jgi:D-2-hydroxyacid dehydrogenase (NADP+)
MSVSILIYEPDSARDARAYREAVARELPDVEVFATADRDEALALAPRVTALAAKAQDVRAELVAAMPRLDWIQALTTGIDPLLALKLPSSITITSARGIHGPQMAELAILLMLALGRSLPKLLANQHAAKWQRWGQPLLLGKTVVIVGVGTISEVLAGCCHAFGLRVLGITSRTAADGFDELHPRARLKEIAARADFLVVLAPYSAETHHLIDAAVLASMKRSAFLINIARGNVIDEGALIEALRARRIAGAGLDVFATEPLPAASPLWALDNVILTPHVGGLSDVYVEQVVPVLLDNLRAYRAGDRAAMRNVIAR